MLDMPYLFPTIDIARATLDDPEFCKTYDALYPEIGLKLLMISDIGYRQTSSSRKLQTLEDFKGLDIRTMENPYSYCAVKSAWREPNANESRRSVPCLAAKSADGTGRPLYINFLLKNYQEV